MIAAFVPDLMDRSRFAGHDVTFTPSAAALAATPADVYVVDLRRPGALDAVRQLTATGARVVGFGSHVDTELMAAAADAGCTEVFARSLFFARLGEILG